jgi:hypothetical protein
VLIGAAVWAIHPGNPGFRKGSAITTFSQTLTLVVGLLCLGKRVSYRRLRKEFGLDDETLEDVRHELIVMRLAVDEGGQGLALVGAALFETGNAPPPAFAPAAAPIALPPVSSATVATLGTSSRVSAEATPAAAAASEAERRQLTVMFCDLVESTALSAAMDPEDLRDVIASFQSRCSAAIRRYDGFVAKYMGDGTDIRAPMRTRPSARCGRVSIPLMRWRS